MIIDVHAHYFPKEYIDEVRRLAQDTPRDRVWMDVVEHKVMATPAMWSVEEHLPDMDAAGIDVQVLSLSVPNVYVSDPEASVALAQIVNDAYAAACARYPKRFAAFAAIPMASPKHAIDELHRAIGKLGLHGVSLGGNVNGRPLNSPEFVEFYDEVDKLGLTICIHPMIPAGFEVMGEYELDVNTGFLCDTTMAATRLVFSGVFERCKNIKMILPHLGGVIPYTVARIDGTYRGKPECRKNLSQPPSEYFKRFYYDSINFHRPALMCALQTVGAGRIVLGSDYPFMPIPLSAHVANIRELGLPAEDEEAIFSKNVLGIIPGLVEA